MTSLSAIRPQTTAVPLKVALSSVDSWELLAGPVEPEILVGGVSVSTDDLEPGWIFVGVPGQRRHGASLAGSAKAHGAAVLVTDHEGAKWGLEEGLPTVVVQSPRRAAAQIAEAIYGKSERDFTVVGVTGTNGKTTTTYLLRAALAPLIGPMGLLGTVEVDTGSFRTSAERTTHESPVLHRALAATAEAGLRGAVLEVSSHALSLDRVLGISFDLAVFTNLQHDHLDFYHNSMEEYFDAKAMLFDPSRSKQAVVAVDDTYGRRLAQNCQIPAQAVQVLTNDQVDLPVPLWRVTKIEPNLERGGTSFIIQDPSGADHNAFCPIPGLVNVQDAALALVGAASLGVPMPEAIEKISAAPSVPGRMQWIPSGPGQPRVIVDYAHTPEAVSQLLEDMRPLTEGRLVAVFGTDGDRDSTKRVPLAEVAARGADVLWVTDENPRTEDAASIRAELLEGVSNVRPDLHDVTEVSTCRRDAVREAILSAGPKDLIVLFGKGSEPYQEVRGVMHRYSDAETATEVLRSTAQP